VAIRFAREGWPFVAPFLILALLLLASRRSGWAAVAGLAGLAVLLFFRDPPRRFQGDPGVILAPADGLVTGVDTVEDPEIGPGRWQRVVTFLSVFDVHVQRSPTTGRVVRSSLTRGRKVAAFRPNAGAVNERHLTVLQRAGGDLVGVRQIAGLLARRVVCYLEEGQDVERGQHLGLIKFGSRVDLLVPPSYRVLVTKGDRVKSGVTPVAMTPSPGAGGGQG
jgi:phosphatidylserine decarboxylase